jgi:hypothetical protein
MQFHRALRGEGVGSTRLPGARRLARHAAVLTALAAIAHAGSVSHTAVVSGLPPTSTSSVTLPKFDPALGVLRAVTMRVQATTSGTIHLENTNPNAVTIFSFLEPGWIVAMSLEATPLPPDPGVVGATALHYLPTVTLDAYDGAFDYSGPSGGLVTYQNQGGGSTSAFGEFTFTRDDLLQPYHGPGNVTIPVQSGSAIGPSAPAGVLISTTATVSGSVRLIYEFDPVPASICRATAQSGCPCGNASATLAGCGNSLNQDGGLLVASGTASISADSLVLGASGMTNSSALFAQGTSYSLAQTPFGDGLRCIGGTVRRLGIQSNSNGASQYPGPGQPGVAVRGLVTAPGLRTYQVHYRDVGAFCTPALFNMTSGVAIAWQP